jgi:hypothetical protein
MKETLAAQKTMTCRKPLAKLSYFVIMTVIRNIMLIQSILMMMKKAPKKKKKSPTPCYPDLRS